MKNLIITAGLILLAPALMAKDNNHLETKEDSIHLEKTWDFSLAYTKKNLTSEKGKGSIEGDGIKLSVGKIFNHSNRFQTTTSFIYSSIVFDTLKGSKSELDSYGFGLSQRFTYAFKPKNLTLKPYLDFILGQDKFTFKSPSGRIVHSIYNKLGSSIGLKFENQDGLSTFLEYNRAVLNDKEIEESEIMDRGYTIGLSYHF